MIYLIYPSDPSTSFLDRLIEKFAASIEEGKVRLIECQALDISYEKSIEEIKKIPEHSKVIFMGHGTPTVLYGGASESFQRKALIELKDMSIFNNKTLILMSCYSTSLLKSSRKHRGYSDSIGFGLLPSDLSETKGKAYLDKLNLNKSNIEEYQICLVDIFEELTYLLLNTDKSTKQIVDRLKLLINTKINDNVLMLGNTALANLLYYTNVEIHQD